MSELIIVGAGLGAQSITLAGIEALRRAEVVLYDRLIHPAIREHIRCESVDVGKRPYDAHCRTQAQINELIIAHLQRGKRVVRLKGGDTSVFARTVEEVEAGRAGGARVTLIPGVTSASSLVARVQSALTDRRAAAGVVFITGLVNLGFTLVIYMGVRNMPVIRNQLLMHGMAATTPVLIGQSLETDQERIFATTLDEVLSCIADRQISHPATIIIGKVARLSEV
jgi:uroporphyrin-III C-methyltransferase